MNPPSALRLWLTTVVATLAALASMPSLSSPAEAATPQLRVAVDNGRTDAKAGATSVYTLTVTNLGTSRVRNLRLSQSVPAGSRLVSAGAHGKVAKGQVTWTVDLPAAGTRTVRTTLQVDKTTPGDLLRLATVACVRRTVDGPPLVCAADSDQLPAGAAAAKASPTTSSTTGEATTTPWAYVGGGAGLLLVAGAAVLVVRRRRGRVAAPDGVGTSQ